MIPDDYCQHLAARPGSDFHYSLLGLPLAQRQALCAVQAFYLETTRIAEECRDPGVARTEAGRWQTELGRLFGGEPRHPVTQALQPRLAAFNLPEEYLREILDGAAMDLEYDAYPGFTELTLYVHRLGSVPALLAAEIAGYQDRRATPRFAHEAGAALLLFERLHDARHHAQHGRFYLPEDEMRRFGVSRATCWRRRPPTGSGDCSPSRPSASATTSAGRWTTCRTRTATPSATCWFAWNWRWRCWPRLPETAIDCWSSTPG